MDGGAGVIMRYVNPNDLSVNFATPADLDAAAVANPGDARFNFSQVVILTDEQWEAIVADAKSKGVVL